MRFKAMSPVLVVLLFASGCKTEKSSTSEPAPAPATAATPATPETPAAAVLVSKTVEAACGMCVFEMDGVDTCELAVRIDGKAYLVTGSKMDDHGDAHAPTGMCEVASQAKVEGKVKGDRFVASSFELVSSE